MALFVILFATMGLKLAFFSFAATPGEHIISTLYAYPTQSAWTQVEHAAPTVSYAIVDICAPDGSGSGCNSNPADAKNTDWTPTLNALRTNGITPLYYISTNYGAIALTTLEQELQQAITWYGTASPMFDTMQPSGTCSNGGSPLACTTYNKNLYDYAVNAGAAAVVYNAGTTFGVSSTDIFGSKEILQVFEGTAASFESTSFPSWMSNYAAGQFAATLSAGSASRVGADVNDAAQDHIGNFYEDDEAEPPNYATLPSFWGAEVSAVAATSSGTTPTPSPPKKKSSPPASTPASGSGSHTGGSQSSGTAPKTSQKSQADSGKKSSGGQTGNNSANGQSTTPDSAASNSAKSKSAATGSDRIIGAALLVAAIAVAAYVLRGRIVGWYSRLRSK